jgi:hypothetical protein
LSQWWQRRTNGEFNPHVARYLTDRVETIGAESITSWYNHYPLPPFIDYFTRPGQPAQPPGGNFPIPSPLYKPLLRFECWPGLRPYVSGLDATGSILFSTSIVNTIPGATYDPLKDGSIFLVSAQIDGKTVVFQVSLSSDARTTESQFTWSKLGLVPRQEGYNLTCSATSLKSGKVFQDEATVFYMPPVPESVGNVVQTDGHTGAVLVPGKREPLLPFGFYTAFGGYLDKNLSVLDEIKKDG